MVVPVKAVTTVLSPKDHIYRVEFLDNNLEKIYYHFNADGYISIKARNGGQTFTGYGAVSFGGGGTTIASPETFLIRCFPLGSSFTPGGSMPETVIDVSDFKSRATISLNCQFYIDAQYAYQPMESGDTSFYVTSSPYVCWYDQNGNFIDQTIVNNIRTDITLEDVGNIEDTGSTHLIDVPISLSIPEGAVYIAPCIISYLYPPDSHAPHSIATFEVSTRRFGLTADKNLLIEQSETLQAVEEQLDDLNDKADTIINGDQQQQDNAQVGSENAQQNQQEMDDILAQLEDYETMDTASAMEAIQNFLDEEGWNDVREVIGPVIDWSHTVTIMLIVLSLINLSIILFGR